MQNYSCIHAQSCSLCRIIHVYMHNHAVFAELLMYTCAVSQGIYALRVPASSLWRLRGHPRSWREENDFSQLGTASLNLKP